LPTANTTATRLMALLWAMRLAMVLAVKFSLDACLRLRALAS
jgi:hypothetical protein